VTKEGGKVHAPARNFPDRGHQAIVADLDGIPVGLLQSSSGDSADDEPKRGDWNWFELYVKSPMVSSAFYHAAVGFDVDPETKSDRTSDFVLSSSGEARGGVVCGGRTDLSVRIAGERARGRWPAVGGCARDVACSCR
jgi:predicted enzyme related to lactoylglutathione lyase